MSRKLPIIPTILVVAAIAVMIALGFWQLGRADEKAALIADFEQKAAITDVVEIEHGENQFVYRTVRLDCDQPREWQAVAGRSANGRSGYAHRFACEVTEWVVFDALSPPPLTTYADIGWSSSPQHPRFDGGTIEGVLVRLGHDYKVVASEPLAGLQPLAKPDPRDLPNNHLAYAGQWFFFALVAGVIYLIAVRKRLRENES